MREIQASEAKVRLPQLLDDIEREEIDKFLASIRALRKRTGRIALSELLSARDEGRKA
jgi:hypothetical protein